MFKVLEKFSKKYPAGYTAYFKRIQCQKCMTEKVVRSEGEKSATCLVCKHNDLIHSPIGKTIGNYEILSFDRQEGDNIYYIMKCIKCGNIGSKRKYHFENQEYCWECKPHNIAPTLEAPVNVLYGHYKSGARLRKFDFSLTIDQFRELIFSDCHYCKLPPCINIADSRYNKTNQEFRRNGIDRKDSSKGYSIENAVACCTMCNRMKLNYTEENWLNQIKRIYKNMIECSTTIPEGSTSKWMEMESISLSEMVI